MKNRFLSVALSLGMVASCAMAAGCGDNGENSGSGNNHVIPEGVTAIKVATYDGGVGKEWLEEAGKRFAEKYSGKSFEDGKTGVYVDVVDSKTGEGLVGTSLNEEVYFTEMVEYYYMQEQGMFADMSDVVNADLGEYGESGKTIASKLDKSMSDFLTAKNGKYYAIPFYDGFYGFVYDVDMFEANNWFFDESGNFTSTNKSKGLDGKAGTYDDGLPKTYAQFTKLVNKIRGENVTPFLYSDKSIPYFTELLASYWANYEGKDKMMLNWTLDGKTDVITSFNGNTPVIGEATVSTDDANSIYNLQKQPGKYYALSFLKDIMMSDSRNMVSDTDHINAQLTFITSYMNDQFYDGAVAMLVDGAWFENEAEIRLNFDSASQMDGNYMGGEYRKQRRFSFMPIPAVDESKTSQKQTLVSSNNSFCFISNSASGAKLEVAKEFVKFLHTDKELGAFTATTSMTRPFNYNISDEQKNEMSYYAKSLYEMKSTSDIIYPYSNNAYYVANSQRFTLAQWAWKAKVDGKEATNPFSHLYDYSNTSAKAYFEGLYAKYVG